MKKTYLLLFLAFLLAIPGYAQKRQKSQEDMKREILDFKLKFLAQEMDLKEDQQKQFFELYSQMESEKYGLYKEARKAEKKVKEDPNASDEDFQRAAEMTSEAKMKEAKIEEKYNEKFKTFLSPKQMYAMKQAEDKFREKLREMKKDRERKK